MHLQVNFSIGSVRSRIFFLVENPLGHQLINKKEVMALKNKEKETQRLYCEEFDPNNYIKTYYSRMNPEFQFFLTNLHNFFSLKGIHSLWIKHFSFMHM